MFANGVPAPDSGTFLDTNCDEDPIRKLRYLHILGLIFMDANRLQDAFDTFSIERQLSNTIWNDHNYEIRRGASGKSDLAYLLTSSDVSCINISYFSQIVLLMTFFLQTALTDLALRDPTKTEFAMHLLKQSVIMQKDNLEIMQLPEEYETYLDILNTPTINIDQLKTFLENNPQEIPVDMLSNMSSMIRVSNNVRM